MSYQCIQNDLIPPLIKNNKRDEYLQCLNKAQTTNDIKDLTYFLEVSQIISLDSI